MFLMRRLTPALFFMGLAMSVWADGYVTDISYITGFYRELTPTWLNFAALQAGSGAPPPSGFHYADLGCGLGHGTALMAATHPGGQFHGFDFNPQQIGIATRLARRAGLSNVKFVECSFEQLASDEVGSLPQFDYIVLHGIWAWISETNRRHILEFIRRKLRTNGIVYVSYNCNVAWMPLSPIQQFMRGYAVGLQGNSDQKALAAFGLAKELNDAGALYFKINPEIGAKLERAVKNSSAVYLAHEYLNESWHPASHVDVRADLAAIKCDYLCSATLVENIDQVFWPENARAIFDKIQNPALREVAKDLFANQQFRRDLYIRGRHKLSQVEQQRAWHEVCLVPNKRPPGDLVKFRASVGEVTASADIYGPLIARLFAEGALSFAAARQMPQLQGKTFNDLTAAFCVLVHLDIAHPVSGHAAQDTAGAFNQAAFAQMMDGQDVPFFALPRHGSGLAMPFVDAALLASIKKRPDADAGALIREVWQLFVQAQRRPMRDGKPLMSEAEAIPTLENELGGDFLSDFKTRFKGLGLID